MCFSFEADVVAAAVIAPVGVASWRTARVRRRLPLAAVPGLLALHQAIEAVVWLGLDGRVGEAVLDAATRAYLLIAQPLLPALVPAALLLAEPDRDRRRWMLPPVVLGAVVAAWLLWIVAASPVSAVELDRSIAYRTELRFDVVVGAAYAAATLGPALISTRPRLRWFGLVNAVGVAVVFAVNQAAFTSLWCLWAAPASVLILLHLRAEGRRIDAAGG